jgi:hypothetical protein
MKQALEALEQEAADYSIQYIGSIPDHIADAIKSLRTAIEQAEKQEPWQWNDAPIKTQWGQDMVVADLEIDKDHTVSVYCERDQTKNVEAMFAPQPQREQVMYQLSPTDIYDFAGWLTTRKGLMQVGGAYEAGPMAEAVDEYLKTFPERFATAQREWVGLTDEEIDEQQWVNSGGTFSDFARAIEAKLKEKNNA